MGTLLDDFLEIHATIGGIIFMGLLITFYILWERKGLFEATVEEKNKSLVAPGSKPRLAYLENVSLGRLEWCKFSQNSDVATPV